MSKIVEQVKVLLKAVPTYGALAVGVLTYVSVNVVPALPGPVAVKVAAYVAAAIGAVQAVVSVVSRVTPILEGQSKGVLPPVPPPWDSFWDSGRRV